MITNTSVLSADDIQNKWLDPIRNNNLYSLEGVKSGAYALSEGVLQDLYNKNYFSEVRMECYKPYHGRRVHLAFFSTLSVSRLINPVQLLRQNICPGTDFRILSSDTGIIGKACFTQAVYQGRPALYNHAMYVSHRYHVQIYSAIRMECDDYYLYNDRFSPVGVWRYYVR